MDFEKVVKMHYRNLYLFGLSLCSSEADAGDLTQHTFLQFAKNFSRFNAGSNVKSWLFTTLYHRFIDIRRRSSRFTETPFEEEFREVEDRTFDVATRIDAATVRDCMLELEEHFRSVLSLFYLEGFSYKEIAEILELPVGTVMSRLHRGKALLASLITDYQPKEGQP